MSTDRKKTDLIDNTLNKPKLISEGIFMYPERLNLNDDTIGEIANGGYVVVLGNQYFILSIPKPN